MNKAARNLLAMLFIVLNFILVVAVVWAWPMEYISVPILLSATSVQIIVLLVILKKQNVMRIGHGQTESVAAKEERLRALRRAREILERLNRKLEGQKPRAW